MKTIAVTVPDIIKFLLADGETMESIAVMVGVSGITIYRWRTSRSRPHKRDEKTLLALYVKRQGATR